jgi:hypothetical protein
VLPVVLPLAVPLVPGPDWVPPEVSPVPDRPALLPGSLQPAKATKRYPESSAAAKTSVRADAAEKSERELMVVFLVGAQNFDGGRRAERKLGDFIPYDAGRTFLRKETPL